VKRALAQTIVAIEAEAVAPCLEALREAERVLGSLAAIDAAAAWDTPSRVDLVKRAVAALELARPLLAGGAADDEAGSVP
jgi:hypothetical protein